MRNIIILFIEIILLIVLIGLYTTFLPEFFNISYISYILVIVFISLIVYSIRYKEGFLKSNYITISFLFLLSFSIVHFQLYLDYAFSLRDQLNVRFYLDYNIVPKAITLAAMALLCYIIGVTYQTIIKSKNYSENIIINKSFSMMFLKGLFISLFFLNLYVTPIDYYQGNYGDYLNNNKISFFQLKFNQLFQVSIWSYIICIIISLSQNDTKIYNPIQYIVKFNFIFIFVIAVYSFLTLSAGSRGPIIKIFLLLFVGYILLKRQVINPIIFLVLIFVFGYFVEFIGFYRNVAGDLNFLNKIDEALVLRENYKNMTAQSSIFPPTIELAESLGAYQSIVMDQEYNNKLYGLGLLGPLIGIIPGLGSLIKSTFSIEFVGSAQYTTEMLGSSFGTGTTALADIYLNFGVVGVIIIFLAFGYYVSSLDSKAYKNFKQISLFNQVIFMVLISNAIYLGRASIFYAFSEVVLVYLILSFSIFLSRYSR